MTISEQEIYEQIGRLFMANTVLTRDLQATSHLVAQLTEQLEEISEPTPAAADPPPPPPPSL